MGFVAICSAIYDYQPQSGNELQIREGELLYILEKSTDDDWWRARKRALGDDEDEPEGLVPSNYVEDAKATHTAKALFDYTRQTDEEISFTEEASLEVFDTSDPDWTLVGSNGEYGFAPSNYIELSGTLGEKAPSIASTIRQHAPNSVAEPASPISPGFQPSVAPGPAESLARILGGGAGPVSPRASRSGQQQFTPEASDEEEAPALPRRPVSQSFSPSNGQHASPRDTEPPRGLPSPPPNRNTYEATEDDAPVRSPSGFRLYHINEMVSAMGRRRKMPTTLGLHLATGVIMISPEKTRDGPSQEWSADKMPHYSMEGKHVFIELVRPSKSLDLHAGNKDTAQEIVAALGEIAGAFRAEGLSEVIAAASGGGTQKKGQMLYDFMAQGDDEVTVAIGDEVVILDDRASDEWWKVRRIKTGHEGVVPSSYVEVTGIVPVEPPSRSGINAGRSTVEQNRLEEERMAREAVRSSRNRSGSGGEQVQIRGVEVGPGMVLPERGSSLADEDVRRSSHRDKRSTRSEGKSSRTKPDPAKVREWTDHSRTFRVTAQFIALADGKIHLHKENGVKIAVPITKMSPEDLRYIQSVTNEPIDDHVPLRDVQKRSQLASEAHTSSNAGASVNKSQTPDYDWFDFFLKAGVSPHHCERYAQSMTKDSMDESVLPDITAEVLRSLGLKEGDILKVMKFLDQKYGRSKVASEAAGEEATAGGLFSGPGGALRDNTKRGRPEVNRQTSDIVDANALAKTNGVDRYSSDAQETPVASAPAREKVQSGFDDDAWEVRPSKQSPSRTSQSSQPSAPPKPPPPVLTGALAELSLLSPPLQPTSAAVAQPPPQAQPAALPIPQQPTASATQQTAVNGANPSFFAQINSQATATQIPQLGVPRQRPQAPAQNFLPGSLLSPPPRPMSAPQNFNQQNQFGPAPLQPQLTGVSRLAPLQAPPGQSLNELNQQRLQQQYGQIPIQSQPTGFALQNPGLLSYSNGLPQQSIIQLQQTGYAPLQQQPTYLNGNAAASPFADPRPSFQPQPGPLPLGYSSFSQQGPPPGGINSILPPALQPQKTAFTTLPTLPQANNFQPSVQPQPTGFLQSQPTSFGQPGPIQNGFGNIQPQQTGFGQPLSQQNGFSNYQAPPVPPIPQQPTLTPLQPQKTGPAPPVRFGVTGAKKLTPQQTGMRANLSHATAQNPFGFEAPAGS